MKWIVAIGMAMLMMVGTMNASATSPDNRASANVLFVLDDGSSHWQRVSFHHNITTLNASIETANRASIAFNYTNTTYGAYVDSIGGVSSPADYAWWWELMVWNRTNSSWDESQVGASDLILHNGDSIAWIQSNRAQGVNEMSPPPVISKHTPSVQEINQGYVLIIVLGLSIVAIFWLFYGKKV